MTNEAQRLSAIDEAQRVSAIEKLRAWDITDLELRAERFRMTRVQQVIPNEWFAPASSECRELYVDGHFYGCVALSQAVAEGLAKFLLAKHGMEEGSKQHRRLDVLEKARIISPVMRKAFGAIRGTDRNAVHHLNRDVPRDYEKLRERAEECIDCLFSIENALFAADFVEGGIRPHKPELWPRPNEAGVVEVFLRLI